MPECQQGTPSPGPSSPQLVPSRQPGSWPGPAYDFASLIILNILLPRLPVKLLNPAPSCELCMYLFFTSLRPSEWSVPSPCWQCARPSPASTHYTEYCCLPSGPREVDITSMLCFSLGFRAWGSFLAHSCHRVKGPEGHGALLRWTFSGHSPDGIDFWRACTHSSLAVARVPLLPSVALSRLLRAARIHSRARSALPAPRALPLAATLRLALPLELGTLLDLEPEFCTLP